MHVGSILGEQLRQKDREREAAMRKNHKPTGTGQLTDKGIQAAGQSGKLRQRERETGSDAWEQMAVDMHSETYGNDRMGRTAEEGPHTHGAYGKGRGGLASIGEEVTGAELETMMKQRMVSMYPAYPAPTTEERSPSQPRIRNPKPRLWVHRNTPLVYILTSKSHPVSLWKVSFGQRFLGAVKTCGPGGSFAQFLTTQPNPNT